MYIKTDLFPNINIVLMFKICYVLLSWVFDMNSGPCNAYII